MQTYTDPHDPTRTVAVTAVPKLSGYWPNCIPAPHDETLLEQLGINPFRTGAQIVAALNAELRAERDRGQALRMARG